MANMRQATLSVGDKEFLQEVCLEEISSRMYGTRFIEACKQMVIADERGTLLDEEIFGLSAPFPPFSSLTFGRGKKKRKLYHSLFHVRRVLLCLAYWLVGPEKMTQLDTALLNHQEDLAEFLSASSFSTFLITEFKDHPRVLQILKTIKKNITEYIGNIIEAKTPLEMPLSGVSGSWIATVVLPRIQDASPIVILHSMKMMCSINRFGFLWELKTSIPCDLSTTSYEFLLQVNDFRFNLDFISKSLRCDVIEAFQDFLSPKLRVFISNHTIPMIQPLGYSNSAENALEHGELVLGLYGDVIYQHINPHYPITSLGKLILTNYRLIFESNKGYEVFNLPLTMISKFIQKEDRKVEFATKEFFGFHVTFPELVYNNFMKLLERVFPIYFSQLFSFVHAKDKRKNIPEELLISNYKRRNGWAVFSPNEEIKRAKLKTSKNWRCSCVNENFQLCPSYPRRLMVPASITDEDLLMAAQTRKGGRIPILSWLHKSSRNFLWHGVDFTTNESGAVASGIDNTLRAAYLALSGNTNNAAEYQNDCFINNKLTKKPSLKWKSRGGSKEEKFSASFSVNLLHLELSSISSMVPITYSVDNGIATLRRSHEIASLEELEISFSRLHALCSISSPHIFDTWCENLEQTQWLQGISKLMSIGKEISKTMFTGTCSVFLSYQNVEYDRSCQISSLAQLWMDPYFRSLEGFIVLIEKEWNSFGFPFADRCALYGVNALTQQSVSPVFIQFLDCVWQSLRQYPQYFEFNDQFLIEIASNVYSGHYGTFQCNNEYERQERLFRAKTESLWTHMLSNESFKNVLYVPYLDAIFPSCEVRSLSLWVSYFLRWFQGPSILSLPRVSSGICGMDILSSVSQDNKDHRLIDSIALLERVENKLKEQIVKEKKRLKLLEAGLSLDAAKEALLLSDQSEPSKEDSITMMYRTRSVKRLKRQISHRNSTPAKGITALDLVAVAKKKEEDDEVRVRTARSYTTTPKKSPKPQIEDPENIAIRKKKSKRNVRRILTRSGTIA